MKAKVLYLLFAACILFSCEGQDVAEVGLST